MTDLLNDVDTPSDGELISRVRGGDTPAYGLLFSRHRDAANRLARQLVQGPDSDDLVSEAFAKVLTVLKGGGGPDVAFRAYLLTSVRRLHVDRVRSGQRLQTTGDMTPFDPGVPFQDTAVAGFESGAAAKAFASLPERWQLVLWHLEVEGQKPAEIAPLLGMSANSVSALAYRAREGLRQAFLTMHLTDISGTDCRWVNEHLGAFVRKGLSQRDAGKVQSHLDGCRRCTAMHLELTEVNSNLAAIIAPLLLGAAGAGYLAASGGAGATGVLSLVHRARELAAANTGGVLAGAVSVGVAAAAVVVVTVTHSPGGDRTNVVADPPAGVTSSAPASPGASGPGGSASGSDRPTDPGSVRTPSTTRSPTGAASAGASPSSSPSSSPASSGSPSSDANDLPVLPTGSPSATSAGAPAGTQAGTTGGGSGGGTGGDPTPNTPAAPTTPVRVVGDPVVRADGTVTVTVRNLRADDTLDVTIRSDETTFAAVPSDPSCSVPAPRHVTCVPGMTARADRSSGRGKPVHDYTVSLPLDFPGYLVEDDLRLRATVTGAPTAAAVTTTFRPSRTPTFDFTAPVVDASSTHTLAGDVDRYDFTTRATLPPRVKGLVYRLGDGARLRGADVGSCTRSDDLVTMTCPDVQDGDLVHVPVAVTSLTEARDVSLSVEPLIRFDDPVDDSRAATLRLRPGADLGLDLAVLSADPDRNGLVSLTGTLTGVRAGMDEVTYEVSTGATFSGSGNPSGCRVSGASMTCPAPTDGQVSLVVRADRRNDVTPVTVSVAPAAPFEPVGVGSHATELTLPGRAVHDFSLTDLVAGAHSVSAAGGGTDSYTLSATVGDLPPGVRSAGFAVTEGGVFSAHQTDPACRVDDTPTAGAQVVCAGLTSGDRVQLVVESTTTSTHDVGVAIEAVDPYDDLDPDDNTQTVRGLAPGTHLALSPADLGDLHQSAAGTYRMTTAVSGIRAGLEDVALGLGDGASFQASLTDACELRGTRLVCAGLADGDQVSFTVTSDTPGRRTPVRVTASPGGDFVDVYDDNTVTADLVPSSDFAMGTLTRTSQTLSGDTDDYQLASDVTLPSGVDALVFRLDAGGAFADTQDTGCTRLADPGLVRCAGLTGDREVDFHVRSTSTVEHPVRISLQVPDGYDDPVPGNDDTSVTVRPGVDLTLADLDPDAGSPSNHVHSHLVSTVLGGVRAGVSRVTYTLSGDATFLGADGQGCSADGRTLTCERPADGELTFTVRTDEVRESVRIGITARAAAPFVELDEADNTADTSLSPAVSPDVSPAVSLDSLLVTGHRDGNEQALVRAQVSGVPAGVDTIRIRISGATAGTGAGQVHLTDGVSGADGEGQVDCFTTDASGARVGDGLYATCTGVTTDPDGTFLVTMRVAHPHGRTSTVSFTVLVAGADEGSPDPRSSRVLSIL